MHMTPPHLQRNALSSFDTKTGNAFSQISGCFPNESQWNQACCGFKQAGLGLRSANRHAEAAFLASTCSARVLSHQLNKDFSLQAADQSSDFGKALQDYNNKLPLPQQITATSIITKTQKALSQTLDTVTFEARLADSCLADQATLQSERG